MYDIHQVRDYTSPDLTQIFFKENGSLLFLPDANIILLVANANSYSYTVSKEQ